MRHDSFTVSPHRLSPDAPKGKQSVTLFDCWRVFLVVIGGIVAGYGVGCLDALHAVAGTFLWHRAR
jgi:hypothetical protein